MTRIYEVGFSFERTHNLGREQGWRYFSTKRAALRYMRWLTRIDPAAAPWLAV